MSLVPKIKVCILSSCDKIDIFEQTGIYNPNNLTGWGTPNINTNDIGESDVSIYDKTGNTLLHKFILKDNTTDVYTSVVGSPTPGPFLAKSKEEIDFKDGIYQIDYNILTQKNCAIYNFYKESANSIEGFHSKLTYKDCNGNTQTHTFESAPFEFSFCGIKNQIFTDIYYFEEDSEGIVIYTELEDKIAFEENVTETNENCGEGDIYQSSCYLLNTCALEKCIKNLKTKAVNNCDAEKLTEIKNQIDQLELIFYGIKSAFSCKDFDTVESLLANAKIICDNLCDCGCGDC